MRTEEAFDSLKSWHLARLRALAHENSQSYSPSALMQSDQDLLSRVAGEAEKNNALTNPKLDSAGLASRIQLTGYLFSAICLIQLLVVAFFGTGTFQVCMFISSLLLLFCSVKLSLYLRSNKDEQRMSESAFDLDEKNKLMNQVRRLQEAEKLTVDFSSDLLFVLSESLQIKYANQSFIRFFECSREEAFASNFKTFVSPGQTELLSSGFERSRTELRSLQLEIPVQTRTGIRYLLLFAEWSGSNNCFFCQAVDVSSAKELEQVKQRFFSMISHDLRSPLQSMEVAMDLLLAGRFGQFQEQASAKLQSVQTNIHRLMRLTGDLLDLDKMQVGKLQISKTDVESEELLQSSTEAVTELAAKKNVKITCTHEVSSFKCDQERMVQVLVNLLSNAIKYTPVDSTVSVAIRTAGKYVEILVTDQGPGLDEIAAAEIFNPYSQVPQKQKEKGFGLGLSISKAIVELHGGTIGLSSSPGRGTSFWVRIPAG